MHRFAYWRRVSFAQGYLSFAPDNSQSCLKVLKDHQELTGLFEISSPDLGIDPRSFSMYLCVKQFIRNFIFNVNNVPLTPRYRQRTSAPVEVKKRCFGGCHAHILKGARTWDWWWISSARTIVFSCEINFYSIDIRILRLYHYFKSFHAFPQHVKKFLWP